MCLGYSAKMPTSGKVPWLGGSEKCTSKDVILSRVEHHGRDVPSDGVSAAACLIIVQDGALIIC